MREGAPPPPIPEGTYTFVISVSTGPSSRDRGASRPTFIGLTVAVADGPHAGRSFEQKVFHTVTNYGETQRLVSATDVARAIEGPDAPTRTFEQAAGVIEQARKQRLPFAGRVTWGATDSALYNQLAGSRGNARGRDGLGRSPFRPGRRARPACGPWRRRAIAPAPRAHHPVPQPSEAQGAARIRSAGP